jgi:GNAT superfamily N-acetyltransferase
VGFNVLGKFQRQGIGKQLMAEAEKRIKVKSKTAGIGFGLTKDYGKAHILYINRNYVPDGNGVVIDSESLKNGTEITIGDNVVMHLTKHL